MTRTAPMIARHRLREDARRALRHAREFVWQMPLLHRRVEVLRGERRDRAPSALRVFCVVRDGAPWLERFLAHHRALGDVDFVFMLNDSGDDTEARLLAESDTVVLRSNAPYAHLENTMKRYLLDRFGADRWCLFVDIDELFDFPGAGTRSLDGLLAYLDARRFTAAVTQMLDLFPVDAIGADRMAPARSARVPDTDPGPNRDSGSGTNTDTDDILATHVFHELASIERSRYPERMRLDNDYPRAMLDGSIASHRGGVRKRLFGSDNGLTKISLMKNVPGLESFVLWHHCRGARLADVSCVLRHYPFAHGFREKVDEAVASGRYGAHTTDEYARYRHALAERDGLVLHSENAIRYSDTRALLDCGFLHASPTYEHWPTRP